MNDADIHLVITLLKKQVMSLDAPWMENMVRAEQSRRDPFKVLVSCILSLRTQDRTTGEASERLFNLAPDIRSMAKLPPGSIEKAIYPVGFYRVKAHQLAELCSTIIERYNGRVPDDLDELLTLRGVGRKTANLVLTLGYKKPGICVDTHVHRITNRWGYVTAKTPEKTEFALRKKLPRKYWLDINGLLVTFGQNICRPLSPLCSRCSIARYCDRKGVTASR